MSSASKCIKLLKQGSDVKAPPVFILPVVSGTTGCWDEMLNSFTGYKRSVYGLIDPYLTGDSASLHLNTRDMMAIYVEAIMLKQPKGPYTLMGYSQGGQWTWSVADILINDKKEVVEQMVLLDPVYPTWDGGKLTYTFMPVLFPALVGPAFFFPNAMLQFLAKQNNAGFGVGIDDGKTEAKRAAHMATTIKNAKANVNFLEFFLVTAELDTGTCAVEDPWSFLKQQKGDKHAAAIDAFAKAFPGLEKAYIEKVYEIFAVSAYRASLTTPCKLPKSTKITLINPERITYARAHASKTHATRVFTFAPSSDHVQRLPSLPFLTVCLLACNVRLPPRFSYKSPSYLKNTPLSVLLYPLLGEKFVLSIAKEQGLYSHVEEESQITEFNVPLPPKMEGSDKPLNKLKGEMAGFAGHFRLTHDKTYMEVVKKEAFIPLGILA